MEKKTIEQMRNAVLAYCETTCPKDWDYWKCESHDVSITCRNSNSTIPHLIWHANVYGSSHLVSPKGYCDNQLWSFLYRALGLSERDAIADYKKSLQSDLNSMTAIVSSVKQGTAPDYVHVSELESVKKRLETAVRDLRKECDLSGKLTEENTALEKRNAALVAALGKIRNACRIAVTTRDFQEKGTMYKIETCIDSALAANEKGGSND